MTPEENRMSDLKLEAELEALIIDEADPKEKIRLLMMLKLHGAIVDNVVATRKLTEAFTEHRSDFERHVEQEMKAINFRRGAIWAATCLLGIIQALVIFMIIQHMNEDKETRKLVDEHSAYVVEHKEHHKYGNHQKGSTP